jgi:hypothetical protein
VPDVNKPPDRSHVSKDPPLCRAAVQNLFPDADVAVIDPLARIWDEHVRRIFGELMALVRADNTELHINVREDMVAEFAKIQFYLAEAVIQKRTEGRDLASIDPDEERLACLGPAGAAEIIESAQHYHEHVWRKLVADRWGPQTERALEREANPRKTTLPIKPVEKNHFIPRWFIRDHWAEDSEVTIWRRNGDAWGKLHRNFGKWGFRPRLYSDRLEAYLSLYDGDAKDLVSMLLERRPLNQPQRTSWVSFLVVQVIRNPFFIDALLQEPPEARQIAGESKPITPQELYEALYDNNEFYDAMARPLMWSRWAIVRSEAPLFVLPDRFCAHGGVEQDFRIIVPLTPHECFVTLRSQEPEKRIIPFWLDADPTLSARIAGLLVRWTKHEFLADSALDPKSAVDAGFSEVLCDIETAINASDQRPRFDQDAPQEKSSSS